MARVFRRPGDECWWLDYSVDGRRYRVKTNTKSRRVAEDLLAEKRADITRVKLGLEVVATARFNTLGAAWEHWLKNWCPERSSAREWRRYRANVEKSWLASERLTELSGERLERWFAEKLASGQKASYVNGHRRILRAVFNSLLRHRMFRGVNPVKETKPLPEEEFPHELLTEAEFKRVLPHLAPYWRDVAVVSFTTGLRRGEVVALRKDRTVLDLERHTLTPRASNAWRTPKGKKVKGIPLFAESLEVLQRAWDAAKHGELLFPSRSGGLRSEHLRPAEALRSAMARAGLVESWTHTCRRKGCTGKLEGQPDEQQRQCPRCGWVLWPSPVVRQVRFHDLRHSCAAYLLDRGVDLFTVSQLLRHSSIEITRRIYAHRTTETLRRDLDRHNPLAAQRQLQRLATEHPELAELMALASQKLAPVGHQPSNVVPLNLPNQR